MPSTNPPSVQARDQALLKQVFTLIQDATLRYSRGDIYDEELPSSAELAKQLQVKLDHLKKKMRLLKEEGLIQAITVSPKRYRVDTYSYQRFCRHVEDAPEHPLAFLLHDDPEEPPDEDPWD